MFLVTRPQSKADETVRALKNEGFEAMSFPVMRVETLSDIAPVNASTYDALVVTSTYTEHFLEAYLHRLVNNDSTILCVGDATASMLKRLLQKHQLTSHIEVAKPQNSEGVIALLSPFIASLPIPTLAPSPTKQEKQTNKTSTDRSRHCSHHIADLSIGVVKGVEGRRLIETFLHENKVKHDIYEVYRRRSAIETSNLKQLDVTLITCVVLTSVEVAEYIFKYIPLNWPQHCTFMVASERIEAFVKSQGAFTTVIAAGASTSDIVACAKEYMKNTNKY